MKFTIHGNSPKFVGMPPKILNVIVLVVGSFEYVSHAVCMFVLWYQEYNKQVLINYV